MDLEKARLMRVQLAMNVLNNTFIATQAHIAMIQATEVKQPPPMVLRNLTKTCECNPAQWEAVNERGEDVYIRYRFDNLTVHCPYSENATNEEFYAAKIFELDEVCGDSMVGVMETAEMLALTGYTVAEEEQAV